MTEPPPKYHGKNADELWLSQLRHQRRARAGHRLPRESPIMACVNAD